MLRIVQIISDLLACLFLLLMVVMGVHCVTLFFPFPMPEAYQNTINWVYGPFIKALHDSIGQQQLHFKDSSIDLSYGIVTLQMAFWASVFYMISFLIGGINNQVVVGWRRVKQLKFTWKINRMTPKAVSQADHPSTEKLALVAISLENLEAYPMLQMELRGRLEVLPGSQKVFQQDNRILLRFVTSTRACLFMQDFDRAFRSIVSEIKVQLLNEPQYRAGIHSLDNEDALFEEDGFIWAMVQCAAPFDVHVSSVAKQQLVHQAKTDTLSAGFKVVQVGTFSRLGHRTNEDVYRLDLKPAMMHGKLIS